MVTHVQACGLPGGSSAELCEGLSASFPPLDVSYLLEYCNKTLDGTGSVTWGSCDDGGYGEYASRYDACLACQAAPAAFAWATSA
eukprot:7385741-Prymnesium_polylepis.1